ncbi:hypothetical protein Acr_11g0011720 [Actinidia rufa]|uniref:Uncharacterized protein n=1 Tax=Actinidia rufa TaxID=165716 RepID=A0A7J0FEL1_9ERIC|nr:hypothetical protein Acr_11g0011720 [Actinidia rufa]
MGLRWEEGLRTVRRAQSLHEAQLTLHDKFQTSWNRTWSSRGAQLTLQQVTVIIYLVMLILNHFLIFSEHGVELSSTFDAKRSDSALPSYLHTGVSEFCLDRACGLHTNTLVRASFQCLKLVECVHRDTPEKGATFNSKEISAKLGKNTAIAKSFELAECLTSIFSNFSSANSLDSEEEEGEEANQLIRRRRRVVEPVVDLAPTAEPILLVRNSGANLSSRKVNMAPKFKTLSPSKKPKKKGKASSAFTLSSVEHAKLWKPEFFIAELKKQVTMADSAKDHDTSLALAWAVMLQNDVTDIATEGSEEIHDLLLGIPANHPTWSKAAPEVELSDSPEAYSPLVLLGFDEEEYLKNPTNDVLEKFTEVANTGKELGVVAATRTRAARATGLRMKLKE